MKNLRVAGFRNLAEQAVSFSAGVNFISGRNGEGKTNLLEAIYVLSLSKSFRSCRTQELIRWGEHTATVFGVVHDVLDDIELAVSLEGGSKRLYVNQTRVPSVVEYLGRLTTITFNPADLALVKGAPVLRRRFLDKHITDLKPSLMRHFLSYQRALSHKQALLKEGADQKTVASWNVVLAQCGLQILQERKELLSRLQEKVNAAGERVGVEDGAVKLELQSTIPDDSHSGDWKGLFDFMNGEFKKEQHRRKALYGPHRDEILISIGGVDSRAYASQGQTRSLVLSLKLAMLELVEEDRGDSPVLLLDDVDSELDAGRREALFKAIFAKPRQVIITGTDDAELRAKWGSDFQLLTLKNGRLER